MRFVLSGVATSILWQSNNNVDFLYVTLRTLFLHVSTYISRIGNKLLHAISFACIMLTPNLDDLYSQFITEFRIDLATNHAEGNKRKYDDKSDAIKRHRKRTSAFPMFGVARQDIPGRNVGVTDGHQAEETVCRGHRVRCDQEAPAFPLRKHVILAEPSDD